MKIFEKEIFVSKKFIDFNGHVNNLAYIDWMINSAIEHSASLGFDEKKYKEINATWYAKSHCINYKYPAFENDKLVLKTWIEDIKKVVAIRKYEIYKDNRLIADGRSEWVYIDLMTKRPKKIPNELIKLFL